MDSQTHPYRAASKSKTFLFYVPAILILSLAILITLPGSNFSKTHHLKTLLSLNPRSIVHKVSNFVLRIRKPNQDRIPDSDPAPPYCVLWMAPFLSGGGYSSEAWSYILSLQEHVKSPKFRLAIEQHGDLQSLEFWKGLPEKMQRLAIELHRTDCAASNTIVVCHSEPGAWYPPLFQTLPCPPSGYGEYLSVIGRTMFESDRVNPEHAKRCNRMDQVWVPTDFHVGTFVDSGVDPSKVVKVVQPIDVEFFDQAKYEPLDLGSFGNLVLGEEQKGLLGLEKKEFVFLSIFKWEYRKGWDVLLKAYLNEFSRIDGVSLYLLTNPYHTDRNFGNKIVEYVKASKIEEPNKGWPPIYVIDTHIAQVDLPRMYKAADAFVLPSRGEGWGRPLVEAMAMSLPVIATNWSGPTEYLTDENSYPLPVERMSEVLDGPFKGHLWAEPSVNKLRMLMRHVVSNPADGKAKGRQAREDMRHRFAPEIVAEIVADHLEHILEKIT
ncbi:uncharacterized protein LOC104454087 [Eucalyptus grandis]|nr:uncharacterized protein LOC104454087 [Eucalyptus grandis]